MNNLQSESSGLRPLVSVTITTRNEEANTANCLRSIQAQSYPADRLEVVVVDNGSTDRTKEIAREFTDKVFDKGPERSAQRNFGMIDNSLGEYVLFLDADMILAPTVVDACVDAMESMRASALHIPEIVLGAKYFSRVRRFERTFYDGTSIDGARFFRKADFVSAGGFDESMSGPEDWDIDKKIKKIGRIALLDGSATAHPCPSSWALSEFISRRGVRPERHGAVIYHNEAEFDLGKYLRKKGYYAGSFDGYIAKWGAADPDLRRQFGLGYRFFGVFLENGKWLRLLTHPFLAAGMYFLRFLVGLKFLTRKSTPPPPSKS